MINTNSPITHWRGRLRNKLWVGLLVLCFLFLNVEVGRCTTDETITTPVVVRSGRTQAYENTTIYYDSSLSPVFTVSGSLRMVNCKVIPLGEPVDFI